MQQLVLDHEHASAGGGERNHDQHDRPEKLFLGDAQDQGKHDCRNQQRRKLGEQLQSVGVRLALRCSGSRSFHVPAITMSKQ